MLTLHDALREYVARLRVRAKPTSVRWAEAQYEALVRLLGRTLPVESLSVAHVDQFAAARVAEGASRETANNGLRLLRAALRHAHEVHGVPVPRVRLLRVTRRLPAILDEEQQARLLKAALPPADLAILLAARAGLRHQEILHLTWADVDLEQRILYVRAKAGWSPKSHAERCVPLAASLAARLACRRGLANGAEWVFPGIPPTGPLTTLDRQIQTAFRRARLYDPKTKPGLHALRRTWASALLARGADVETVRELGGWADLSTVQRYLASTEGLKRRAIEALET